jgi:hypothetical protein
LLGLLTKISGLIVGVPVIYVILRSLPADGRMRVEVPGLPYGSSDLGTRTRDRILRFWAVHVSHTYPPTMWLPALIGCGTLVSRNG